MGAAAVEFFLGTHEPNWLARFDVPLFVSHVRLMWRSWRKPLPRARGTWALDSGGFSMLRKAGRWHQPAQFAEYGQSIRRYEEEIGNLRWCAVQDWMCEPEILQRTGLSVQRHQELTVQNYEWARWLMPDVPWVPVLQGWGPGDHLRHYDLYLRAGHDLRDAPVVGVGTVCRRQGTKFARKLLYGLAVATGLKLHGFGLKTLGLRLAAGALHSADSMAWSFAARRDAPLEGCTHRNCANCPSYALAWRARLLAELGATGAQSALPFHAAPTEAA